MKSLFNKIWKIYKDHEEVINYLFFGGLTTIVSIGSYAIFAKIFGLSILLSNILSWILAVLFAFITNKIFVFKSKNNTIKDFFMECIKFYSARIFSLGVESLILYIGATVLHINDIIVKVFAQVIVVILNYILSKLIVFKGKKN